MESKTKEELDQMNREEVIAYFAQGGDFSALFETATNTSVFRGPAPNAEDVPMQLTSIRLPLGMVDKLDKLAEGQKGGRSEVIRLAVELYLAAVDSVTHLKAAA